MSDNKIVNIESLKEEKNVVLHESLNEEPYYIRDFYSNKEYKAFLNRVTRLARSSTEYKKYIAYLMNRHNMDRCSVLGDISTYDAEIEFHHYPFTIFDLANIIVLKRKAKDEPISSILCARELMQLHENHYVGLVPLSVTVHQLAHSGEIFIPLDMVFGRFQNFVENYKDYIPEIQLDNYNLLVEKTHLGEPIDPKGVLQSGMDKLAVGRNIPESEDIYDEE